MGKKIVLPAILTNNREDFWRQFEHLNGVTDWMQIDLLDGMYVDSTSIGLEDMEGIVPRSNLEAHLLVIDPEEYLEDLKKLGFKRVVFHLDASEDPWEVLEKGHELGLEMGLALNPCIDVDAMEEHLDDIDLAMLMSVDPGAQGQSFIPNTLKRIGEMRELMDDRPVSVDGGIKLGNIKDVINAGADHVCIGSAITGHNDPASAWRELHQAVNPEKPIQPIGSDHIRP